VNDTIQRIIACRRFAVVGVSRGGKKIGNAIVKELTKRGYEMFPVHPSATELEGRACAPNLQALQGTVDAAIICIPPAQVEPVLRDAAAAGTRLVWMQQGASTPALEALARELGLETVTRKCIMMYAPPVDSIHKVHRFFVKLFGRY
jgi:predicted CoA-binding protein